MPPNLLLESLSLTELKILLGHLKLGKNHLTVLLDEANFNYLLELGNISFHTKSNVSTNTAEKLGNIALILNTIITSCFGAWMGLYGFLGLKLDSFGTLIAITIIAAVIALGMSAVSIKLTNTEAQEAMYNQKVHNLQSVVLKNILSKLNEEFKSAVSYLNHSLCYLNEETNSSKTMVYSFKNIEHFYQWYEIFANLIAIKQKNEKISSFFTKRLEVVVKEMKDLLNCHFSHPSLSQPLANKKLKIIHAPQTGYNSLLKVPREQFVFSTPKQSWLKRNYFPLLAGLPPVMLGGFASMFVFLTGGPNLAKELGLIEIMNLLKHPVSEFIEFTIALGLTFYYGWAFFYSNYRNHMRQMELAKTKRKLGFLEKKEVFLERRVSLLLKLKQKTQQIIDIFSANNAISSQNQ